MFRAIQSFLFRRGLRLQRRHPSLQLVQYIHDGGDRAFLVRDRFLQKFDRLDGCDQIVNLVFRQMARSGGSAAHAS